MTQKFSVPDVNVYSNYSLGFSANKSSIVFFRNGKVVFAFGDENSYNANNSRYISFSQFSSNVYYQNVRTRNVCAPKTVFTHFSQHMNTFAQMVGGCPVCEQEDLERNMNEFLLVKNKLRK